jgi:cytochrome c oxidase assembly factor CtaG/putative copper export protein
MTDTESGNGVVRAKAIQSTDNRRRRAAWVVFFGVSLVAGLTAAFIGALGLADVLAVTGLADPGPVTTYGLSFVRAAGEIAAVVAVGHFLFAASLVPPQPSGVLDVDGYRALRIGAVSCAVWAVCAALLVALTVSDVSGVPVTELTPADVWSAAGLVETTSAWRTTSILAAVVAVTALAVLRWSWTPVLCLGGLTTLVPLAVTGHSSSGGSHDIATNSLLIHLVAGALWAGGLLALLGHALRGGGHTDTAARRFSSVALWCFAAMAVSGIVNAAVRIAPSDIRDTPYGVLIAVKVMALAGLGVIGWRQRRTSVVALQRDPTSRRPLVRLALTEAALFAVAVGVAVGLGRTPPPPSTAGEPSPAEVALGFDLPEAPTIAAVFTQWRFDLLFGTAAVVLAVAYLAAVRRLVRRGEPWSIGRTACWMSGCLIMLVATSSGLGTYMTAMYSMHVVVQLLLTVVVPALLVVGAPATLAMRALRAAEPDAAPGPREWLQSVRDCAATRVITQPVAALVVLAVGVYGLVLPGVFTLAVGEHTAHVVTIGYFLFSGTVLFAAIAVEPMPGPRRLAVSLVALSQICVAGIVVMNMQSVLGDVFYRSLKLTWHGDLLGDQRLGGVIGAVGGAVAMLTVIAVPVVQRYRSPRGRPTTTAPSIEPS